MTIFGVDSSHYDWARGGMDLAAMATDGIVFATHKVSEGTGYVDPYFAPWTVRARGKFGLLGGYCVNRRGDQRPQVDRYIDTLDRAAPWWRDGDWLVQLDCERWSRNGVVYAWEPRLAEIHAWCDYFVQRTGGRWRPIVYAPKWVYGDTLRGLRYPTWASGYGANPTVPYRQAYPGDSSSRWAAYSGQVPAVLQFGARTTIGIQRICDANAFRGTLDELRALTRGTDDDMFTEPDRAMLVAISELIRNGIRVEGNQTHTPEGGKSQPINPILNALWRIEEGVRALGADLPDYVEPEELAQIREAARAGAQAGVIAAADELAAQVAELLGDRDSVTVDEVKAALAQVLGTVRVSASAS